MDHGKNEKFTDLWQAIPSSNLVAEIKERFGPPGWLDLKGRCTRLNERFWAELYKAEHEIIHERDEQRFYQYEPENGLWQRLTANAIKTAISDRVRSVGDQLCMPQLLAQDTEHNRRDIVSLLNGITEERDFFRNRPHAIHASNCMLVFENRTIVAKRFAPEFLSRNQL